MADSQNEKERITSKLAGVRTALSDQSLLVRRNLDVGRQMSDSVRRNSWAWMSMAAIFGWLLSRLPARKKKIYIHASSTDGKLPKAKKGFRAGLVLLAWDAVWSIGKPLLTAYLTRKFEAKGKVG